MFGIEIMFFSRLLSTIGGDPDLFFPKRAIKIIYFLFVLVGSVRVRVV